MVYEADIRGEDRVKFCAHVKQLLEDRGMTLRDLAEETGYAYKSVLKFFSDHTIANKIMAAKIINALDIEWGAWR